MMKSLLYNLMQKRHFWRYATFSEIAELYTSRTIRIIAMNIVSGFTSVYLYESGYSLSFIMGFWMCFYALRMPISIAAGYFVARFGPKHGILISNILYVPSMAALGMMPELGMTSIILWGLFMAISTSLYRISYTIDFSKVKNAEHAGKELAYMNILEKIAIGVSPVLGGVIALWYGLQTVIWVAAILFAISVIPLFRTMEPVRTHQKIDFAGFPVKETYRSILAQLGVGFDFVTTGIIWSMFIVIVIFPGAGWEIYVKLGALSSVTIIAAIAASYTYGKLIDKNKGGDLLRISVVGNAIVHIMRAFVNTPISIVGTNIVNEIATMGYSMSFMRGIFDTADLSGHRIVYLTVSDLVLNAGASMASAVLLACIALLGDTEGLRFFFFFAAIAVLWIGTANFRLYRK
jgi:MFS family permease